MTTIAWVFLVLFLISVGVIVTLMLWIYGVAIKVIKTIERRV